MSRLHAFEAEKAVLGACLRDGEALRLACEHVSAAQFEPPGHSALFEVLEGMRREGLAPDVPLVLDRLAKHRHGETLKGLAGADVRGYLLALRDDFAASAVVNVPPYCAEICEAALLRAQRDTGRRVADATEQPDADSEKIAEMMRSMPAGPGGLIVRRMSELEARPIEWLWRDWIPLGMVTVLDGDPGLGKSTFTLDIAARLSRGDCMPDGSPGPARAGTVFLTKEDDYACVVRPRLDAAGADPYLVAQVVFEDADCGEREPDITSIDMNRVTRAALEIGAKAIVIDPLVAYLPVDVNAHRDQDVRRALALLKRLAERTGAAVLAIRHLNKTPGGQAIYRGGGSIGIIGAARSGLLMTNEPGYEVAEGRRVLAVSKSNIAKMPTARRLRVVPLTPADGSPIYIAWEGTSEHTADTLLAALEEQQRNRAREGSESAEREAKAAEIEAGVASLSAEVASWTASGQPMRVRQDAVPHLVERGLSRDQARRTINERNGRDWRIVGGGRKGNPEMLAPMPVEVPPYVPAGIAGIDPYAFEPHQQQRDDASIPAEAGNSVPPESSLPEGASFTEAMTQDSGGRMNGGSPESIDIEGASAAVGSEITGFRPTAVEMGVGGPPEPAATMPVAFQDADAASCRSPVIEDGNAKSDAVEGAGDPGSRSSNSTGAHPIIDPGEEISCPNGPDHPLITVGGVTRCRTCHLLISGDLDAAIERIRGQGGAYRRHWDRSDAAQDDEGMDEGRLNQGKEFAHGHRGS